MARPLIPSDRKLYAAVGKVALAHGHLELVQKFLIRNLAGIGMVEALQSTQFSPISDVQKTVKKLARRRQLPEEMVVQLSALLNRATLLSRERNKLLHRAIQMDKNGRIYQKRDDHTWGPAPSVADLDELSQKMLQLSKEINEERLTGFIRRACRQYPLPNN